MNSRSRAAGADVTAIRKPTCFVITPIGSPKSAPRLHADWVFHRAVTPACEEAGLSAPDRADRILHTPMITAAIFKGIEESDICIADLTFLNPNVFYELGIRHAIERPVIHIAQSGTVLPFDNGQHFTHFFDVNDFHEIEALRNYLVTQFKMILSDEYSLSNPLTQARGRKAIASSADSKDQLFESFNDRLRVLEAAANFHVTSETVAEAGTRRGWWRRHAPLNGAVEDIMTFVDDVTIPGIRPSAEVLNTVMAKIAMLSKADRQAVLRAIADLPGGDELAATISLYS